MNLICSKLFLNEQIVAFKCLKKFKLSFEYRLILAVGIENRTYKILPLKLRSKALNHDDLGIPS